MSRKYPVERPRDGYAASATLYPDRDVDMFEIHASPSPTAEVLASVPIPRGVNRVTLSQLRFEFNMAGVIGGQYAQRSIFEELLGLVPELSKATLFPTATNQA